MRKLLVLCLLLLPLAAGDNAAYGIMDDVTYAFAYGAVDSMHASIGPSWDGQGELPVNGCSTGMIRLDEQGERGRVQAYAFFGGSAMAIDFTNTTSIVQQELVDGSISHDGAQHPEVMAEMAMYGHATIIVDGEPYYDPVTLDQQFVASYMMTPTGYRHDGVVFHEDGGLYAPGDPALIADRWETHLRVEGAEGPASTVATEQRPPDGLAPGRFTRNVEYRAGYEFYNQHFNGEGTLTVDFESEALAGMNNLDFRVRAPDGEIVANLAVVADLQNPGTETVSFALDQFGFYYVEITGAVTLSQYTITLEQESKEPFDLWFWWENTEVGVPAWIAFADCYDYIGEPNAVVASEVRRIDPPQMNLTLVTLGIVGTIITLMVGGRLFGQTVSAARFNNTHRKR